MAAGRSEEEARKFRYFDKSEEILWGNAEIVAAQRRTAGQGSGGKGRWGSQSLSTEKKKGIVSRGSQENLKVNG